MKKRFVTALITCFALAAAPLSAFARTENHVDKVVSVKEGTVFTGNNAPRIIIGSSDDHIDNFKFGLSLSGAEWNYEDSGVLQKGVTYEKMTDTWLIVSVNLGTEDGEFNAAAENLAIPLVCEITGGGDITVSVGGYDTTVSSGTYTFAKCIDGATTIEIAEVATVVDDVILADIVISDESSFAMEAGDKITLQLDNNFTFKDAGEIKTTGKFDGNVSYEINGSSSSKAVITVESDTDKVSGKIVLSNVVIEKGKNSAYGPVDIKMNYNGATASLQVASFGKLVDADTPITIKNIDQYETTPELSGQGAAGKTIQVKLDGEIIGTTVISDGGEWSIGYPVNWEPLATGTHVIQAGYYRASMNKVTKEVFKDFETRTNENKIVVSIGSSHMMVGQESVYLDAPAYIDQNNRAMLPLRAVANALGITDDQIEWDPATKVVTLTQGEGTKVEVSVGSKMIAVNGENRTLDTEAVVQNGRTFLPMRAMLNAFGISDSSIQWDDSAKTVTVIDF